MTTQLPLHGLARNNNLAALKELLSQEPPPDVDAVDQLSRTLTGPFDTEVRTDHIERTVRAKREIPAPGAYSVEDGGGVADAPGGRISDVCPPGMIDVAQKRCEGDSRLSCAVEDAMAPSGEYAALFSAFGLQQMPDHAQAIQAWTRCLKIGGVAVVIYWPMGQGVEKRGPWAHWGRLLKAALGDGVSALPTASRRMDFASTASWRAGF